MTASAPADLFIYHKAMTQVLEHARTSPDPATQNAAVLLDPLGFMLQKTLATNEFPSRVKNLEERWERPAKYQYVAHAEANVVAYAAREGQRTQGRTLLAAWAACTDCAKMIIQAGIRRLVTMRPTVDSHGNWGASIDIAMVMLEEAGVEVVYLDGPFGVTVRRNGEDVEF